jgi:biofilm PGA synthesis lipoprotein PgaB
MRAVQALGARHIGYYPDDFLNDRPSLEVIRPAISSSDYPYAEPTR